MSHTEQILACSAGELAALIHAGEVSPMESIDASLHRIEEINPVLNAFTAIYREDARREALAAQARLHAGEPAGPLLGVPVAIKDMTPIKGKVTTLGSRAFEHHVSDKDAWIVTALRKSGAIIVGKTTTPEFAHSSFTHSPLTGVTRNPWDPTRTPGGSSGGSAVAVATNAVPLAEGTDMGGSIRIPAALCGVVGLKPSLGRVPLDILPSTFDNISHIGPLARSCEDAALFLSVTQGPDDCDIQSIPAPFNYRGTLDIDPRPLRIALSIDLGFYAVDEAVEHNTQAAAECLRQAGATVETVELNWSADVLAVWMDYWRVFMAAYYGSAYDRQAQALDPAVRALIEQGRTISAVHYKQLEIERTRFWHGFCRSLQGYDALICPTTAVPAPSLELNDRDFGGTGPDGRYAGLDMTSPFNLIGQCPALSVPSGWSPSGCPTGLQIIGRRHADLDVLRIGALLEKHLGTNLHRPVPRFNAAGRA